METLLAIASKREEREYRQGPVPENILNKILEVGRITGTARNAQPCRFIVIEADGATKASISEVVTRPKNILGAPLLIAVTVPNDSEWGLFDAGRAVQNMMIAAWDLGVGTSPNMVKDQVRLREIVGIPADEHTVTILSVGYPARRRDPAKRSFEEWAQRANRLPLDEVVRRA